MERSVTVEISEAPIDCARVSEFVQSGENGAEIIFIGRVRANNLGKKVVAVSYDAFGTFASKIFYSICDEANQKFGSHLKFAVSHRVGQLSVGEVSIVIAVGSPHRAEAYEASRYVIEQTKVRAAIWKREHYEDGETAWLRGHALCQHPGVAAAAPEQTWFKLS